MERILVLGLGNPLLGDEGVGLRALEELTRTHHFPPGRIEFVDGGTAGLSLVPRVTSAGKVLVLDAVRAGNAPGTVVVLDGLKLTSSKTLSPHQIGLGEILAASRISGRCADVIVIGVEPLSTPLGHGLSPPVSEALAKLVVVAAEQLRRWGVEVVREVSCTSLR